MQESQLFVQVLEWAYKKGEVGFTLDELKNSLKLDDAKLSWVRTVFQTVNDQDRKFFDKLSHGGYVLNEKGLSTYIDYLELRDARENSKSAMQIATASLVLASIAGFLEIATQL